MPRLLTAPSLVLTLALACSPPTLAADTPGTDANATPGASPTRVSSNNSRQNAKESVMPSTRGKR